MTDSVMITAIICGTIAFIVAFCVLRMSRWEEKQKDGSFGLSAVKNRLEAEKLEILQAKHFGQITHTPKAESQAFKGINSPKIGKK